MLFNIFPSLIITGLSNQESLLSDYDSSPTDEIGVFGYQLGSEKVSRPGSPTGKYVIYFPDYQIYVTSELHAFDKLISVQSLFQKKLILLILWTDV